MIAYVAASLASFFVTLVLLTMFVIAVVNDAPPDRYVVLVAALMAQLLAAFYLYLVVPRRTRQ